MVMPDTDSLETQDAISADGSFLVAIMAWLQQHGVAEQLTDVHVVLDGDGNIGHPNLCRLVCSHQRHIVKPHTLGLILVGIEQNCRDARPRVKQNRVLHAVDLGLHQHLPVVFMDDKPDSVVIGLFVGVVLALMVVGLRLMDGVADGAVA